MLSSIQNKLLKYVFKQNINGNSINKLQNKNISKPRFFTRISKTKEGVIVPGFKTFDDYIEYFNEYKK